jgi:hypothetical protein
MAITFGLVHAAPYRLRYLCYQDGRITSPPVAANGFATLPNDGGATPDLRTDALTGAWTGGGAAKFHGSPLNNILRARLLGFAPIAAGAITQAQARSLMNSEDAPAAPAVLTNLYIGRCVTKIVAMDVALVWAADWNVDGQGDPVCEVRSGTGTAGYALLDIHYRHSYDL